MSIGKIFEVTDDGKQVVVLKTNDPAIQLNMELEDMIATLTLNFNDNDEGFENRDRAFDRLSEEEVQSTYRAFVADFEGEE